MTQEILAQTYLVPIIIDSVLPVNNFIHGGLTAHILHSVVPGNRSHIFVPTAIRPRLIQRREVGKDALAVRALFVSHELDSLGSQPPPNHPTPKTRLQYFSKFGYNEILFNTYN